MRVDTRIWDDKHLKALLRLPRYSLTLIEQEPWHSWIEQQGGVHAVHEYLKTSFLPPHEQELLTCILSHPGASVQFYCERLCISRRTYANYLNSLCATLLLHLNARSATPAKVVEAKIHCGSVPAPVTALIGAEETLSAVLALVERPAVRCITLIGPGGVGKTRLAIEVATLVQAQFAHGACFVPLDTLSDPALLSATLIRVLNVQPAGAEPPLEALKTYLQSKQLLLILDNLEHLAGVGAVASALLHAAPDLKILGTSRERLNIYGEYCFTVEPLPVPRTGATPEALNASPAIQLFVERARAARQDFALTTENAAAVMQICQHLDGLPLAMELAAARLKACSPNQLLEQLETHLIALRHPHEDRPARHQSLWNVIEWSYRLLTPRHQRLFRHLAVFDHSWDLQAAQTICEDEGIQQGLEELADKSLIQFANAGAEGRFYMLNTLREYALEQLRQAGEAEAVGRRHAEYYLVQAERAETVLGTTAHLKWAEWLRREHGNLQTALRWMLEHNEATLALRLGGAVWRFWQVQGVLTEGRYWLMRALDAGADVEAGHRLKALWGIGWLAENQSDLPAATAYFKTGLTLAQQLEEPRWSALCQIGLGEIARAQQRYAEAAQLFESSLELFNTLQDREEIAWTLDQLGRLALEQQDFERARQYAESSLALFRELGHHWGMSHVLDHLGDIVWNQGHYDLAALFFEEALREAAIMQSHWLTAWTLCKLTSVKLAQGQPAQARAMLAESLQLHLEVENTLGIVACLGRAAMVAAAQQAWRTAVQLWAATEALHQRLALPPLTAIFVSGRTPALEEARARLAPAEFTAAWTRGQMATLAQAIQWAQQVLGVKA